jgi:hypothetical protein
MNVNNINLTQLSIVGPLLAAGYYFHLKARTNQGKKLKVLKLPPSEWLDEASFLSFTAIIDTFIPSFSTAECSDENIVQAIKNFGVNAEDVPSNFPINPTEIAKNRNFLCAGAVDYGTHRHIEQSLNVILSTTEKEKLVGLLKALSTSVGSFFFTGYPVPFHELPLHIREQSILGWRNSKLEQIRTVFQLFKSLVSLHFFAVTNEGITSNTNTNVPPLYSKGVNPSWESIQYDPDASRVTAHLTPKEVADYDYLRSEVFR